MLLAGIAAGMINIVVGSGTLVTFPTLLAAGLPPVPANVSNSVGLVFGGITGTWGYRRELGGQRRLLQALAPLSLLGGAVGAVLLLALPPAAFSTVVPVLLTVGVVLVVIQPGVAALVARHRARGGEIGGPGERPRPVGPVARVGVLLTGVYGGYFGAAQGVLVLGLLGAVLQEPLQRVNAVKNALTVIVNAVAVVIFLLVRPAAVNWTAASLVAVGSVGGGLLGAAVGRRLPPLALRGVIVIVGIIAVVRLVA